MNYLESQNNNFALSVIIPALHEVENLRIFLPNLISQLQKMGIEYEIIVIDNSPTQTMVELAEKYNVKLIDQKNPGYGAALVEGFSAAKGNSIVTMDADLSHPPGYIEKLWDNRKAADIIIASRYTSGGEYSMPLLRTILSRILNLVFGRGLTLNVKDMSSGYRLYNEEVLRSIFPKQADFSILQEILVKAFCKGRKIIEVPFSYKPRRFGNSHARVIDFGISYIKSFWSLYKLRNSIMSADYDARAFESIILPQRYWQRQRFKHIKSMILNQKEVLDVGCGSSNIIEMLPDGSLALDILFRKLRYAKKFGKSLAHASGFNLPVADNSFSCVLCSQVIEHVPKSSPILNELDRALKPGGVLILGTPDYANWQWRLIEALYERVLPSAYADEHISHYSREELVQKFEAQGYVVDEIRYILKGELILKLLKPY